jgi:uncharacterized protein (DUF58 family)
MPRFLKSPDAKRLIWSTIALIVAGVLALFGSVARAQGEYYAAIFLSVISLVLLVLVSALLIPRLVLRLKLDFLTRMYYFRFTRRGALFILIIFILAFSALNTGNNLLILILAALLAALIVSGIVANLVLQNLHVSLKAPESIHAGQTAVFLLTLHNMKRLFPSFGVRLRGRGQTGDTTQGPPAEEATDFFAQEKEFPFVRAGERLSLTLKCAFRKRGLYPVDGFEVKTTFPFGFFLRGRKITASGNIVIYPALSDVAALSSRYPQVQSLVERFTRGQGGGLYNIRDYAAGDNARFVHWKSTAKTSKLMVKDLAAEEDQTLNLVFSRYLPDRTPRTIAAFEKGVSYVATLSHVLRQNGQRFTVTTGSFSVTVNGAPEGYRALMEQLATVQPTDQYDLVLENLPPYSLLVGAGIQGAGSVNEVVDYLEL